MSMMAEVFSLDSLTSPQGTSRRSTASPETYRF